MEPMALRFSDESVATVYDRLFTTPLFEPWGHVLIDLVGVRAGEAVLDVATGPGTVARLAAAQAGPSGRVVGIDISAPMLEIARQKSPPSHAAPVEFVHAPADATPLMDASFDVVVCQQGLQFFPDYVAALREMRRVLKPGGRLGIAVWAKGYGRDIEEVLTECLVDVGAKAPVYPSFGTRADDLPAALSAVGFSSIRCEEKTLQLTFPGNIDRVIEGWGSGPMRSELLALAPTQAEQFRTCVARQLQRFIDGDWLRTPSVARLATGSNESPTVEATSTVHSVAPAKPSKSIRDDGWGRAAAPRFRNWQHSDRRLNGPPRRSLLAHCLSRSLSSAGYFAMLNSGLLLCKTQSQVNVARTRGKPCFHSAKPLVDRKLASIYFYLIARRTTPHKTDPRGETMLPLTADLNASCMTACWEPSSSSHDINSLEEGQWRLQQQQQRAHSIRYLSTAASECAGVGGVNVACQWVLTLAHSVDMDFGWIFDADFDEQGFPIHQRRPSAQTEARTLSDRHG